MAKNEICCKSEYVTMRDGVRVAVSTWLPRYSPYKADKYVAVLTTTRYWRATELYQDNSEFQGYYPFACYLLSCGYALVAVDARGSGASFGCRDTEYSTAEVEDIGEIIEWISRQPWCDGRVATEGTSYTAQTALCSLIYAPKALKVAVCRAPDFDMYRHVFAPGGIPNHWFIDAWGDATGAQDNNDVEALFAGGYWPLPKKYGPENVLGVRPVDEDPDGALLRQAILEHQRNFNLAGRSEKMMFVDTSPFGNHVFLFDPEFKNRVEKANVPIVIRCGWHDAGTALGALSLFSSFSSPIRVVLGPWNHVGNSRADPFLPSEIKEPRDIPPETVYSSTVEYFDAAFKTESLFDVANPGHFRLVEYFTLGENAWKTSRQWPPSKTQIRRLYLSGDHQLKISKPASKYGCDLYSVDVTTTTGLNNRWHAQTAGKPILFPDRQVQDQKLLFYDTPSLDSDVEVTGHPIVCLYVRSTSSDGYFFVYLEIVDSEGRVRMITEGQLRGVHRKVSDEIPPYKMFGPYHSLKKKDALPLVPGEVAEITFDLFPISVLLKKGQRIRLAIAGADADVFAPIPGCESPEVTVERNSIYASYIELPIIS